MVKDGLGGSKRSGRVQDGLGGLDIPKNGKKLFPCAPVVRLAIFLSLKAFTSQPAHIIV